MTGLPECVVSRMSGPPSATTQDKTEKGQIPSPRIEIKSSIPLGIVNGLEGGDSTAAEEAVSLKSQQQVIYI